MTDTGTPDPDDLDIVDHDVHTVSVDIDYLRQVYRIYAEDDAGQLWTWRELHIYNAILGRWWVSSPKDMECVS